MFRLLISVFTVFTFVDATTLNTEPALLVISFDGFKPDYLHRNVTPNLNQFRKDGVSAGFMLPVFPTKTFVNHFSIATGLYPGNHGVLANDLYDSKFGQLKYSYELFHYNDSTIPIWTANEKAGKHSGCMWPGADYDYNGINCTFIKKFEHDVSFEERVDTAVSWFTHEKTPANLIMIYMEEPDEISHMWGSESDKITKMTAKVDNFTRYVQEKLKEYQLLNRVNVIYLSDHGICDVSPPNFINLEQFLTNNTYTFYGSSPILQVVPNDSSLEAEIFSNLTKGAVQNGHFKVYNKDNLPARWEANNARRMGPIIALADSGYGFQDLISEAEKYQRLHNVPYTNESRYGVHGFDNTDPSMRAMFMAKGPKFAKGKMIESVNMVDVYNLFCMVLDIRCGKTDGSPIPWNKLFKKVYRKAYV